MRRLKLIPLLIVIVLAAGLAAQVNLGRRRSVLRPTPAPPAPVANADNYTVDRGKTLTVTGANGVLANDTDPQSKPLTATLVTTTEHGTLTLNADGGFTYANDSSTAATDSFTYKANNGTGTSIAATVTIVITADTPPVAAADSYSLTTAPPLNIDAPGVLGNDTLNNATIISFGASTGSEQTTLGSSTATSQGGTVTLNANGSFSYSPNGSFSGADTFKYVIRNSGGSATGTVTINVTPVTTTPDFFVTSPGFFYRFSGVSGDNPVITLTRGRTYRFSIDTDDIHPFEITGAPAGTVTGNNTSFGIVTFTVPNTNTNYAYRCSIHGFGNQIHTQ